MYSNSLELMYPVIFTLAHKFYLCLDGCTFGGNKEKDASLVQSGELVILSHTS